MALMNKRLVVTLKLPQLQNLIKRDPTAYREEFLTQKRHFESELEIFKLRPTKDSERFTDLINFMSHVVSYYPDEGKSIPIALFDIMEQHGGTVHPDVRAKLFQALILLRNRNIVDPLLLIKLSFKLFSIPDKTLRTTLSEYIFNDIKAININKKNDKLNKGVQSVLFAIVNEDISIKARKTVDILSDLYRRRVWTDERTVNVIASGCLSSSTRVMVSAINFFLGIENKMFDDDEDEKSAGVADVNYHEHSKKTKKRQRHVKRQVEHNSKVHRDQSEKAQEAKPLFPAIQLINDPQSLAEKLFKKLRQSGDRFEIKLLIMNFISRLIGCHRLLLLTFYSFIQRYLTSHQKDVTLILSYLIQACHELTPPDYLMPVVKAITYNFITERCTNEVLAVGINSVREIIVRVPSLLREDDMSDLIQDLSMYSKKMHKSVTVSARGFINLVRDLYPALLKKADRGKFHDASHIPEEYGRVAVADGVEGVELLEAYERGDIKINQDDEVLFNGDEGFEEEEEEEGEEDMDEKEEDGESESGSEDDEEGDDDGDDSEEVSGSDDGEEEGEGEDDETVWEEVDDDEEESESEDEEAPELVPLPVAPKRRPLKRSLDRSNASDAGNADENAAAAALAKERNAYDRNKVVNRVDATRILSSADFALLNRLKEAQAERSKDPRLRTKKAKISHSLNDKKVEEEESDDIVEKPNLSFQVSVESLGPGMKTGKTSKIDRIAHVLQGRKESKFEHGGHRGGLTNIEKERKKNYVMVRRGKKEVLAKMRVSNSDVRYKKMTRKEPYGRDRRKRRRT